MKKIKLTQGKYALVDDKDFAYLNQWKWSFDNKGYAFRGLTRRKENKRDKIMMHRIILNTPKGFDTDHINRNRLDNQRKNLRIATRSQNQFNTDLKKNNTSGFRGVIERKNKKKNNWLAQMRKDGKYIYLGYFSTKELAALAYNRKASELFGAFAQLNLVK